MTSARTPEIEQRMDAGKERDRATPRADAARAAKMRRSAWLLAGLALAFYLGYIAWMFVRSNGG